MTAPPQLRAVSSWAIAGVVLTLGAGLARTVVTARYLQPSEIGLMGIALLALGVVEALSSTGFDTALVTEPDAVDDLLDPVFTLQLVRGLILGALLWTAAPAIAWMFRNDAASAVIRAVSVIPVIRGLANPAVALAVRRLEFHRIFWWSVPEVLSSVAVTLWLAVLRRDVWALVFGTLIAQLVATVVSYALEPRRPGVDLDRRAVRSLLRAAPVLGGSRALMFLSVNLDAVLVGLTAGAHALGLYQLATRVAELPVITFTRAIGQVALPALSAPQAGAATLRHAWRGLLGWDLVVTAAGAFGIILLAPSAVRIVAGEAWMRAVPLMQILAVAMLFRGVIVLVGQLLDARRHTALTLRLNVIRLGTLCVLAPLLGGQLGLEGIAIAVLLTTVATAAYGLWLTSRVVESRTPVSFSP